MEELIDLFKGKIVLHPYNNERGYLYSIKRCSFIDDLELHFISLDNSDLHWINRYPIQVISNLGHKEFVKHVLGDQKIINSVLYRLIHE
jgi:hypothetical protein